MRQFANVLARFDAYVVWRRAVDAYKKDTGKAPTIKVDHKTGQIVIRLGKGESALSFRLKYL